MRCFLSIKSCRAKRRRTGAAAVEFAIVAIPVILFMFASVEFGRGLMVQHTLDEAARAACRAAILPGANAASVEAAAEKVLKTSAINTYDVSIEPESWPNAELWTPITIDITASLNEATWLPVPQFLEGQILRGSSTLPNEVENTK